MCGRYAFYDPKEIFEIRMLLDEIAEVFDAKITDRIKQGDVFPSETAAVLAQSPSGYKPYPMEWGYLIKGSSRRVINARAESAAEKPMFAGSLAAQKCAVPCTGFYEWQKRDGKSYKYLITLKNAPFFYLGGLYNRFRVDGDTLAARFVILTVPAAPAMQDIHSRMPLMIPPEEKERWLTQKEAIPSLMQAFQHTSQSLELKAL